MLKEVNIKDIKKSAVELIGSQWGLVTAGTPDGYNTMTVSWGALGELWGKACVTVYIRPQRYTEEFINSNDCFTLSFYPEDMKKQIHGICGSKSGRDVNKAEACNITPCFDEAAPYFEEAELVIVCRKMAKGRFEPEQFIDPELDGKWYEARDYHNIYYGAIEKVLVKE